MATHAVDPAPRTRYVPRRPYRVAATRLGATALTAAALATAWWALAPPALDGHAAIAVVDGTSMLPHFRRGDLVLLRQADRYGPGDVVGYRSRLLHRVVLHRIVKVENGRYTFKGDNNSWLDPETPARNELIGRLWLRIPRVGAAGGVIRKPAVGAVLTVLLVLGLGLGGQRRDGARP
ncbi:MAG TPA: signal peptidase I [Gaiellaceae bacterium]|nr:signal peptidase I [Gaiellaceae bacterium]